MKFEILYHHKVIEDDLPALDKKVKERILDNIGKKLGAEPEKYGKPLRKPLSSFWKLRIGDYRVVYKIKKREVWILTILHRSKVYEYARQRTMD